jgi:hypothetical protein
MAERRDFRHKKETRRNGAFARAWESACKSMGLPLREPGHPLDPALDQPAGSP